MRLRIRRDDAAAREAGFTMVEMVVTIAIIAALFVAVSMLLDSSLRALAAAKARARANDLATAGIEDLQRYSFNNLGVCPSVPETVPAGLESSVGLVACPTGDLNQTSAVFSDPCGDDPVGTVPRVRYTCTRNNVSYTVRRYVAWVDDLKTTKRLAVYVEWTDLVGNHQVSQQSSLRAPDQSAIIGLAPPRFTTPAPTVTRLNNGVSAPSDNVLLTSTRELASPWSIEFTAYTTSLDEAATTTLQTQILPHSPKDTLTISVANEADFPSYNGFSVSVENETFKVLSGAGTKTWRVVAGASSGHAAGLEVKFGGDRVYAVVQTLGANGDQESSTVLLTANANGTRWSAAISHGTDLYRFGVGTQYVSFGILRAADGRTSSVFASDHLAFCPADNPSCTGIATPFIDQTSVTPGTVLLTTSGAQQSDITVSLRTTNITRSDTVTVSFLTQAGTQTVVLTNDTSVPCPITTTTAGFTCRWVGTIGKVAGYRFSPDPQSFYFAAQQVLDADPTSVDQASTGVFVHPNVVFSS